jgi:hypothetical protein
MSPHGRWDDCDITFMTMMTEKQKKLECTECTNKGDELCGATTNYMKILKYDPSSH